MIPHFDTPWLIITGGDIVLPSGGVFENGTLLVNQGVIQGITEEVPASLLLPDIEVLMVDATNHWVTPGLIDQHLHGALGTDFNQSSVESIHHLLSLLPKYGITGVLPTLMTAPKLEMVSALSTLEEVIHTKHPKESRVFGIHLEGPFLSPDYAGAHPVDDLLEPTQENLEGFLSPSLKRITLAPEISLGHQTIRHLVQEGILCSVGHSGADYATTLQAVQAGASCVTHLFNAMRRIDHRDPGIAVASLVVDELFAELIADGKHLSPHIIQLALKTKPFNKIIVISDCNALTGMATGSSMRFGKQKVTLSTEGPKNQEGHLAGSSTLIGDCVRNIVKWGVLPFYHAVQLATLHPATYLNQFPLFGQIAVGSIADIVLWKKDDLSIKSVFMGGEYVPLSTDQTGELLCCEEK